MDSLFVLDVVLFVLLLISLPIYILLIVTLIRYRNKRPFDSPFFKLTLSLAVFDVAHLIINWGLEKFAQLAWFGVHRLVMISPAFFAKLINILLGYTAYGQKVGVLLAAVNRMAVIALDQDWTPMQLKLVLAVHWMVPALLVAPELGLEFNYYTTNETDGVVRYWEDKVWMWRIFFGCFVLCTGLAVLSGGCYMITFWKARQQRLFSQGLSRRSTKSSVAHGELRLAVLGFVLFVLTGLCGLYCALMTLSTDRALHQALVPFQKILFDVYAWCNPYLLLVCSKTVRKHMKATIICGEVTQVRPYR